MWFKWSQSDQSRQVIDINHWTLNNTTSYDIIEFGRTHLIPLLINSSLLPKYLSTSTYTWCRTSLPLPFTSIGLSGKHCNSNGGSNHLNLLLRFDRDDNLIGTERSNHTESRLALVSKSRSFTVKPAWNLSASKASSKSYKAACASAQKIVKAWKLMDTASETFQFHVTPSVSSKVEAMTICHGPSDAYGGKKQTKSEHDIDTAVPFQQCVTTC